MSNQSDERRTLLIGSVMALAILIATVMVVLRLVTKDERLLVLQRDSVHTVQFEEGDQIKIVGTLRRFGFARGFDAATPGETGGNNALDVISITKLDPEDDVGENTLDVVDARNDAGRREERVVVVGKVDEKLGDAFFTLVE